MRLVFLGPPGAGKGTQAAKVAETFRLLHASTGGIFRAAVAEGSELGRTVQSYLDSGTLVPDELTSRVVREMVLEKAQRYVLDGFPRTVPQADSLDRMLRDLGQKLDAVLCFDLDEQSAIARLTGRLVCKKCGRNYHRLFLPPRRPGACDDCGSALIVRSDSSEDIVRQRLREYDEKTSPLAPYYERRGLLRHVDASQSPDEVTRATEAALRTLDKQ